MEGSDQPAEELEILRKLNPIVSVINEYCNYSGELKPNVLFYLLKLELLNDNSFTTFNEIEVIWTKDESVYGRNRFGQESVVFKNRNTFPSELCDDQITGAGLTEIKNVDGEISEEIIGQSLNDAAAVCKLEEVDTTEATPTPIFVQNSGYEDMVQVTDDMQDPSELQFTLAVQGGETYEYIQADQQALESLDTDAAGPPLFTSRNEALQSLNMSALSAHSKMLNMPKLPDGNELEKDVLNEEVQEKLTKSKQIVVNDRRLVPTYECPECGKKFSVPHHLKNHMLSHYKIKSHVCHLCNKRFSENCHLNRHMKLTHEVGLEKKYPCKVCKKEFPTVPRLVQHLKIHTGDTPHNCELCPAKFPTSTGLLWHKKAHMSEIQYPCEVCGWVYKSQGVCLNHVKKYHPEVYGEETPQTVQGPKSKQHQNEKLTADKKKFNKLLHKLRERNLIKENVSGCKTSPNLPEAENSENNEGDLNSEEEGGFLGEMEEEFKVGIDPDLTEEIQSQEDCLVENPGVTKSKSLEEHHGESNTDMPKTVDHGVKELIDEPPRRTGRKRKVKSLYGEGVPELNFIKHEPTDGEQEYISPVSQPLGETEASELTELKDGESKEEAEQQEVGEHSESPTSVRKKGQRIAKCGHFSVAWDTHEFCAGCRFKGKGPDACAGEEGESCGVCSGFTPYQQQYYKIRKKAYQKKKEICKAKARRKLQKQETAELLQQADPEGLQASVLIADLLQESATTAQPVEEIEDQKPRLEEAQLEVKTYQRELQSKYRWYKCLYCEESFLHKTSLVTHMNSMHEHTEEILFPCTECQKVFATLAQLKRHFTTHGIGAVLTPCPECGRTFRDKSNLAKHRLIHLDVKLFTCEFCGKAFSNCGGLTIHRRTHTGIRPYRCRYCEKAFTNAGALRGHERVHTGEKPYVCDICGVCFRDRSHLNRHKKSHVKSDRVRPYRCGLCGKTFSAQSNLTKHLRGHTMKTEPH